jgi:hypothetical protein
VRLESHRRGRGLPRRYWVAGLQPGERQPPLLGPNHRPRPAGLLQQHGRRPGRDGSRSSRALQLLL